MKALVGAFSVIVQPVVELMDGFAAPTTTHLLLGTTVNIWARGFLAAMVLAVSLW